MTFLQNHLSRRPKKQTIESNKDVDDDIDDIIGSIDVVQNPSKRPVKNIFKKKQIPESSSSRSKSVNLPAKFKRKTVTPTTPIGKKFENVRIHDDTPPLAKKMKTEDYDDETSPPELPDMDENEMNGENNNMENEDFDDDIELDSDFDSDTEIVTPMKEQLTKLAATAPLSPNPKLDYQANSPKPSNKPEFFENDTLQFYWLDAHEERFSNPGELWLTGQICVDSENHLFESCCVKVKNINREVFCLLKSSCESWEDANDDIDKWQQKKRIEKLMKKPMEDLVNPFYKNGEIFEEERNYFNVQYGAKEPPMPERGFGKNIEATFYNSQGPLERFIMRKKVMGPGYMQMKNATVNEGSNFSWCQHHVTVDFKDIQVDKKTIEDSKPPKLSLLTIHVVSLPIMKKDAKTGEMEKTGDNQIIAIAGYLNKDYSVLHPPSNGKDLKSTNFANRFYGVLKRDNMPADFSLHQKRRDPNLHVAPNERALLEWFLTRVQGGFLN